MNHLRKTTVASSMLALIGLLVGCQAAPSAEEGVAGESEQAIGTDDCPANMPAGLAPGDGETLKSKLSAVGVQIYMCNQTATGYGWVFVAPQANLYRDDGSLAGTHFIGPTWQGNDGSSVVAKKAAGVSVDASAVPWLLLDAVSHAPDAGRFSDVTSVQRLSTVGGNAPPDGCDATKVGSLAQVPYTADYFFYRAKDHGHLKQCGG